MKKLVTRMILAAMLAAGSGVLWCAENASGGTTAAAGAAMQRVPGQPLQAVPGANSLTPGTSRSGLSTVPGTALGANGLFLGTNGLVFGTNGIITGTNGVVFGTNGAVLATNGLVIGTNGIIFTTNPLGIFFPTNVVPALGQQGSGTAIGQQAITAIGEQGGTAIGLPPGAILQTNLGGEFGVALGGTNIGGGLFFSTNIGPGLGPNGAGIVTNTFGP